MIKRILVIAGVISAVTISAYAHPQRSGGARPGARAAVGQRAAERLNLTEEQRNAMRAIRERQRDEMKGVRQTIETKALEYRRLADAGDRRAEALRNEIRMLREDASIRRAAARAEMSQILTEEQREQLREMREKRGERQRRSRE